MKRQINPLFLAMLEVYISIKRP